MKKLFLLLTLVGMFFTACESGGGVEEENGGNTPTYKIELSKKTIEVGFEEGDYSVSVTSTCSWKASSDNDWIVIESKTGIAGPEELIFRVLTQTEEKERKGTIVIKNTDFNLIVELYIVQKPFEPKITIDSKSLNFAAQGGEQTVNITANFDYTVSTEANWISYSRVENGLKIRATANTDTEKRTADIVISKENSDISEVININQDAEEAKSQIELSKQIIDVDFEEGSYSISVTSPYSWDAVSKNDWIIVETTTGIAGTEELQFRVLGQTEEKERKGTIVVKNTDYNLVAELYVIQKAFVPSIIVDPETISFTTEGGTQNIAVTANFEYEISISADWVSFTKTDEGLTIIVPNNKEVEERSAVVTISSEKYKISKTIKVAQGAFVPEITIDTEIIEFAAKSGAKDVAITTNFEYEVSTSASWVTYSKNQNGITVSVPNYGKIGERTANITISSGMYNISKTIKIRQKGLTEEEYAEQRLVYTSSDGMVINPKDAFCFDANIVFNTCENGQGVILFDAPITYIGNKAFYECTSLTSVTIPDSVTSIGKYAFRYCSSLTSIAIPNSVTEIGYGAFWDCDSLTSVTIPNSVTSIGESVFLGCNSLTSVTIPDSVTSIGSSAFCNCTSLTSVTIPDSVTSIGNEAFYECTSLTSVTIPNSVTSIGEGAFYGCSSLTSVTIPNSVTSIGEDAFYGCTSLKNITIPDSVTSIGSYAFCKCTSLTSVTIPDGVTEIGGGAFSYCASLTSFYGKFSSEDKCCLIVDSTLVAFAPACGKTSYIIPDSVTSIGKSAFRGCESLTNVTIPDSVTSIGSYAFCKCTSLTNVTIPDSVTSIGEYAFLDCTSLISVTIGNGVTSIGYNAFSGCSGRLTINSKIIETDYTDSNRPSSNWLQNSKFTELILGDNIEKIGSYAFESCRSLKSVTIPDSVTSIGNEAFYYCTSLTSVTIPDSITSIGEAAFCECYSLTSVYCKPTTPPAGGSYMFYYNASGLKIYVPRASVSAYKSASYWKGYSWYIVGYDF